MPWKALNRERGVSRCLSIEEPLAERGQAIAGNHSVDLVDVSEIIHEAY